MRDDASRAILTTIGHESKDVSIVKLKAIAKRMLPATSTLRNVILGEPDYLPREAILPKVEIFVRLLYQELGLR